MTKKIKVVIIDSSISFLNKISQYISADSGIEVVGIATDVYEGRNLIVLEKANIVIMDLILPKMDGLTFLKKLMPQYPLPVIILSNCEKPHIFEALSNGAIDFVTKPLNIEDIPLIINELTTKIKISSTANLQHWKSKRDESIGISKKIQNNKIKDIETKLVAIGASTGGTEALKKVIPFFPVNMPPVVIVQHMPEGFTKMFAESLNKISSMEVKEAKTGDIILPGKVYIAPGDYHMTVLKTANICQIICKTGERVSGHRPSVDVLFNSVSKIYSNNAVGIILTGMGSDGAKGLLEMKKNNSFTIAQDEQTSVVYGMPKVANDIGGVDVILPLESIANYTIKKLEEQ